MRVLHAIPSLAAVHGGPSAAMRSMERALFDAGVTVSVVTTDDDGPNRRAEVPLGEPCSTAYSTRYYFRKSLELYKYSPSLARWAERSVRNFDLVHIHALFSHSSVAVGRAAMRQGVPYIIRPLGVLQRYGMRQRRPWMKRISFRLFERRLLAHASAIHYTSALERAEAEELGIGGKSVVLPLGVDVHQFESLPDQRTFVEAWPAAEGREIVLFLSRLDPKKGLDVLLQAFQQVLRLRPGALLVIAGGGEAPFIEEIRNMAESLSIDRGILFLGNVDAEMRRMAFGASRVFVLPSRAENFAVVVVEAMAAGVPAIVSPEVGIADELAKAECAMVVAADPDSVASAIVEVLSDPTLARRLSERGREQARRYYSLESMGGGLKALYESVLRGAGPAS